MANSKPTLLDIRCSQIDGRDKQCRFPHKPCCEKDRLHNLSMKKPEPVKNNKKTTRKRKLSSIKGKIDEALPEDSSRCIKNAGIKWRCHFRRFEGSLFCEKHHLYNLNRRKKKVNTVFSNATNEKVGVVRILNLGEIWALSEEPNGIPRFYARIDKIIPTEPVMLQFTPLFFEAVLPEDVLLAEQAINYGCGIFKLSQLVIRKEYACFSHKVQYEKERDFYKIFPRKGEVWAVYWDFDETCNDFEYKFVEVVSDFSEEDGICVCSLVVAKGREGIFKLDVQDGFQKVRPFSRAFMSMFSHQVPVTRIEENGELLWKRIEH